MSAKEWWRQTFFGHEKKWRVKYVLKNGRVEYSRRVSFPEAQSLAKTFKGTVLYVGEKDVV